LEQFFNDTAAAIRRGGWRSQCAQNSEKGQFLPLPGEFGCEALGVTQMWRRNTAQLAFTVKIVRPAAVFRSPPTLTG
jgi:hypothetical protein